MRHRRRCATDPEVTLQSDPIPDPPVTMDELVDRFRALATSFPAAVPIMTQVLDHLATMAPDHMKAEVVTTYYRFCRDSPEMAILLAALCHANSPREMSADGDAEQDSAL